MTEIATQTIRESLVFIKESGGEVKILPAPIVYGDGAFVIHLKLGEYGNGLLFDTDLIGRVLGECLNTFCNAITEKKKGEKNNG